MRDARDASVILAEQGGHHIEDVNESFHILENFHPQYILENVWKNLCAYWNTPKWKNISACAKENRNTPDANGKTGRHTGGSIGNADHRRKLKEATSKDPSWLDLFMKTRLDKESKKRYFEGDRSNLHFCSETARQGHRQKGTHKGRMYGIGTADSQFLFTGSLSVGGDSSHYVQNEEVERLRNEMASMREAEAQREARDAQREARDAQRELEMEEMRKKHALLEAQMTDFFKQNNFSGNPPQRN
ncbi:unnamed protein product [Lactuca saligna]|uniref:Uncharacterized protein n=1 Tax=Lactuca saligna TaxID=75948 RepID=A0AA35VKM8_LACSI|nr:unnamed protein product [Lactuca saligna]